MNATQANREAGRPNVLTLPRSTGTGAQENRGSANASSAYREAPGSSTRSSIIAALGGANWLSLAAAPTFGFMALLVRRGSMSSPLSGMVPIYLLLAVFNLTPWLKLISRQRSDSRNR
jgi:hypothetical protein